MKSATRACLLGLVFAAFSVHAAAPDPSLVGCWRAVKISQYAQASPKMEDTSGRCTLQFKEDEFASTCATANGEVKSNYRYQIVRPNFYQATMTASTFRTSLVGSTRDYEYHVDGDRLTTATELQSNAAASAAAVRVETEAVRTPCQ